MKTLCPSIRKILFTLSFLLIPVLRPCPSFSEFDLTSGRHVAPLETYRDIYYKGDTDKALELIDKHIKDRGELMQTRSYRYFVWLADKCYIHFNRGDVDIAIPIMEEIIREFPEPVFILQLAEMYKTRGLQEHYTDLLHRFRQPPGRWRFFHQEENLVAFARIAELNGENPKQLLSTFYTALINNFGDYAPVYIGAADMALRRNAYDLAEKHYQKALVVEPDNANALAGLAMCYHKAGDPRLKSVLAALLQKYPNNLTGNHIQIELLLDTNQIETADKLITPFLERNPNQLTMQSLKAAVLYLQDKTEEVAALQEKILQFNPHCSEIFSIPGKIASRKYRFAEAVAFLQQAITVNEQDIDARAQYALNLLRIGEDGMAKAQLERVFAEDPYHVQVYNQLHLLDSIDTFARIEVGPFVIQMPTEEQPVMSDDVAALLLEAFDHYQKKYEVQLKTPIHIQLFDNHDDFMVRSLGLPGSIGFMGICFGQLVTMDSPSARPKHEMNWRSVLWHEFVHVVTLQKTNNRMPRWLSEGISVYEEKQRSSAWGQDLDIRYKSILAEDEVPGIDSLEAYFTQPKTSLHLMLGYYASAEFVTFYVERYGIKALVNALESIGEGKEAIESLVIASGDLKKTVNAQFKEFLQKTFSVFENIPNPQQEESLLVTLLEGNEVDKPQLKAWIDYPSPFTDAMRAGLKALESNDYDKAEEQFQKAYSLFPDYSGEEAPLQQLIRIYQRQQNHEKLKETLELAIAQNATDFAACKKLITIYKFEEAWDDVIEVSRKALAIDPFDIEMRKTLLQGLTHTEDFEKAIPITRQLEILDANHWLDYQFQRIDLLQKQKNWTSAKQEVVLILEQFPHHWDAQKILLSIIENDSGEHDDE
jgi:tetratricopeptide (TPR) repeat protein